MNTKISIFSTATRVLMYVLIIMFLSILLCMPAYAVERALPGSTIVFHKDLFSSDTRLPIPSNVGLNTTNFDISAIAYGRGASLVESAIINDSKQEVQVRLRKMPTLIATEQPNFSVQKLIIKAKRHIRDTKGNLLIKKGAIYTYFNTPADYIVGHDPEIISLDGVDEYISMGDGENRLLVFAENGSTAEKLTISYGTIASGTMNVYKNSKGYLYYDSAVPSEIQSLNPSANITAINMGNETLPGTMRLTIDAPINSYIYEVANGSIKRMSPPDIKWSDADSKWHTAGLTHGKNIIVSSLPLYDSSEYNGGENNVISPSDPRYWQNKYGDTVAKNPMTGGYPENYNSSVESSLQHINIYPILFMAMVLYIAVRLALPYFKDTKQ